MAVTRTRPKAVVFDMDGVLLDTAQVHARAWKETFDAFLAARGGSEPFLLPDDYRRYVDGRPRYAGVVSFLGSRAIELPMGDPSDPPGMGTVTAVGNLKNQKFHRLLEAETIEPLPGVEELLDSLRGDRTPVAVVSSSKNTDRILPESIAEKVDLVLGGKDLDEMSIPGKPEPDMFVHAAERLEFSPRVVSVVEDSPAGVRAGRRGGFSLVVGIDDESDSPAIADLADVLVTGVSDLPLQVDSWFDLLEPPPSALENLETISRLIGDRLSDPSSLYIGGDEDELLIVRQSDGVGVLVDPAPSVMTWADFSVQDRASGDALRGRFAELDTRQPNETL